MGKHKGPNRHRSSKPQRPPLTHFLCLPLVSPESRVQLQTSIQKFRNEVVPVQGDSSSKESKSLDRYIGGATKVSETVVHPRSIRPLGTLHCTLGVMSLNKDQLEEAKLLLGNLDVSRMLSVGLDHASSEDLNVHSTESKPPSPAQPLVVDLTGISSMHEPAKTSILYIAPTDPSDRLYSFCRALQSKFQDKEFMVKDDRELRLHATIINTIYAKGRKSAKYPRNEHLQKGSVDGLSTKEGHSQGHGPHADAPLKLDARGLLDRYNDYTWAQNVKLTRISICEMGARKIYDDKGEVIDEEYTEVASISLPS